VSWCQIDVIRSFPVFYIISNFNKKVRVLDVLAQPLLVLKCNEQTQKLLGLYIDNTLSWKPHIDSVCAKMSSRYSSKKIKPYLTLEMRKLFYNGYIACLADYACINWSHAAKSELARLKKLQKRACTYILNKKVKTSTELTNAHKELNLLSFYNRVRHFTSIMVFKALHNLTPPYIYDLISPSLNDNYSLRSYSKGNLKWFTIPNTNYFKRNFSYTSINVWNTIPSSIKASNNINTFKRKLKAHLNSQT